MARMVVGSSPTNVYGNMICKYVDRKSLATMLASKRSAGVAAEVEKPIAGRQEASKQEIRPGFET